MEKMDSTDDLKDCWFFDPDRKPNNRLTNELATGRVKIFLYESLYRGLTRHNLYECFQIVKLLPKLMSLDPYILFKFVMILIESNPTETMNKNVIIYLETLISKFYINKPDIFVEFIGYFVKHNRIEDAKELFSSRNRFMSKAFHQKIPVVDINLKCYEFLFNYLQWNDRIKSKNELPLNTDVSFQGRLVNIIDCLSKVKTNHEYFVICLIRILLHHKYYKKSYLFTSEFQKNNPNNISAQLLHLQLLNYLNLIPSSNNNINPSDQVSMVVDNNSERQSLKRDNDFRNIKNFTIELDEEIILADEYPVMEDKQQIMKNLARLDPSREELLNDLNRHNNLVDILKDLMDGLEMINEISNISRWLKLEEALGLIINSKDEVLILDARFLWHTRYKRFWANIKFEELAGNSISQEDKDLIMKISKMVRSKLDRPIK